MFDFMLYLTLLMMLKSKPITMIHGHLH